MQNRLWLRALIIGAAIPLTLLFLQPAKAQSFTGQFAGDDGVALFHFTATANPFLIQTTSYAAGGFDPILSLFDDTGLLIDVNDDTSANDLDSELNETLAPGDYFFTISQYENQAIGPRLTDGFLYTGTPDYTSQFAVSGGPSAPFLDYNGDKRNGNWAVTITGANGAVAVPEPAVVAYLLGMLTLFGSVRLRRR